VFIDSEFQEVIRRSSTLSKTSEYELGSQLEEQLIEANQNEAKNPDEIAYETIARKITRQIIHSQHIQHHNDGQSHNISTKLKEESIPNDNLSSKDTSKVTSEDKDEHMVAVVLKGASIDGLDQDHFYRQENKVKSEGKVVKTFKRSKSKLRSVLNVEFNSIKYRLKRNYFKAEDR